MRNLILILVMALGVTSQAQTFNFNCGSSNAEIQNEEIVSIHNDLIAINPDVFSLVTKIGVESILPYEETIQSVVASMTIITNDWDDLGIIDPSNTDYYEIVEGVYDGHINSIIAINAAYNNQNFVYEFNNILNRINNINTILDEGGTYADVIIDLSIIDIDLSNLSAEYDDLKSPHSDTIAAYENTTEALNLLFARFD